jgi:hypothetical protein
MLSALLAEAELLVPLLHAARANSMIMSTALQRKFLCIRVSLSSIARVLADHAAGKVPRIIGLPVE